MEKVKYRTIDEYLRKNHKELAIDYSSYRERYTIGIKSDFKSIEYVFFSSYTIQGCFKKLLEYVNTFDEYYGIE